MGEADNRNTRCRPFPNLAAYLQFPHSFLIQHWVYRSGPFTRSQQFFGRLRARFAAAFDRIPYPVVILCPNAKNERKYRRHGTATSAHWKVM